MARVSAMLPEIGLSHEKIGGGVDPAHPLRPVLLLVGSAQVGMVSSGEVFPALLHEGHGERRARLEAELLSGAE
jgi:hypothetical protein